jgi:ankyrin repeat protein
MGSFVSKQDDFRKLSKDLKNGMSPNAREYGHSMLKCYVYDLRCFKLLLDSGADPNQEFYTEKLFFSTDFSASFYYFVPIVYCCARGFEEQAKLLIEYGAGVNVDGLLHRNVCPGMVPLLIRAGVDINGLNAEGYSAIQQALMMDYFGHVVEALIKFRPKLDEKCKSKLKKKFPRAYLAWIIGKWNILKPCVKFLSLHARAVVTANHPQRMLERGEFVLT